MTLCGIESRLLEHPTTGKRVRQYRALRPNRAPGGATQSVDNASNKRVFREGPWYDCCLVPCGDEHDRSRPALVTLDFAEAMEWLGMEIDE